MSTTITMGLGVAAVVLSLAAVLVQARTWGKPAAKRWTTIHRGLGLAYLLVYAVMMAEMVPRLWQYQFELPARTVLHAVFGITIGILLLAKIAVIRFFHQFTKALPLYGFCIFLCTMVLAALSLPFAARAYALGSRTIDPHNVERVRRILGGLELQTTSTIAALTTPAAFTEGREVLMHKCTPCHDLRTVLMRPRTGRAWHDLVLRMAERPAVGEPIMERDIPLVTAYLVAITPEIQEAASRKSAAERTSKERAEGVIATQAQPQTPTETQPSPEPGQQMSPQPSPETRPRPRPRPSTITSTATLDRGKVEALVEEKCTECHTLKKLDKHGPDDEAGWSSIVRKMVEEEEAEISPDEASEIVRYLTATRGK